MKKSTIFLFCYLSAGILMSQQTDFPKLTGPYLGQKPPGRVPEIFAPGIISFPEPKEFACAFSPDGKEFYYTSTGKEFDYASVGTTQRIMYSKIEEGRWSKPRPAEFSKGFFAHEPHITFDNKRIFWFWANKNNSGIYYAERTQNGWSVAKYAGPGYFVSSSRDGRIYVGDPRGDSWSRVTLADGRFAKYERLPDLIKGLRPKYTRIGHPCIAPDGTYVVFDVEGGSHLFVSFKNNDGPWSEPVDLTEHGFFADDGITSISADGKYLFFQRNNDLYWVSTKIIEDMRPRAGASLLRSGETQEKQAPKLSEKLSVLKPFLGPTWTGTVPNDSRMGEITLKWEVILNGFAVRLKRNVLSSDHWLETTYYWDESSGKIAYLAISNRGSQELPLQRHNRVICQKKVQTGLVYLA